MVQRIIIIEKRVCTGRHNTIRQMDINVCVCVCMDRIKTTSHSGAYTLFTLSPYTQNVCASETCLCVCMLCFGAAAAADGHDCLFKNTLYSVHTHYNIFIYIVSFVAFREWFCHSRRCTS